MQSPSEHVAGDDRACFVAAHEVLEGELVENEASLRVDDDAVTVGEAKLDARNPLLDPSDEQDVALGGHESERERAVRIALRHTRDESQAAPRELEPRATALVTCGSLPDDCLALTRFDAHG